MRQATTAGIWAALLLLWIYLLSYAGVLHAVDELSALSVAETWMASRDWHVNQMAWDQQRTPPQNIMGVDGNLYTKKGLGVSLAALPLLGAGKIWPAVGAVQLALLTGALLTALTSFWFYRLALALDYGPRSASFGALVLGLGTLLWPYARTFFGESLGALGFGLALAGAVSFRRNCPQEHGFGALFLAGAGLAVMMLAKSSNAVAAPCFALYLLYVVLWERRQTLRLGRVLVQGLSIGLPLLFALLITVGYNYVRFRTTLTFPLEAYERFSTPLWLGLPGLLVSPGKGLLWYVPLAWLALASAPKWRRAGRLPDFLLALSAATAIIVLYALWYDWPGGRAWGPRMIVVVMPAVAMLAMPALAGLATGRLVGWRRWAASLLVGLSVLAQLPGVVINFELREALDMQAGVAFNDLVWQAAHMPLRTYWTAFLSGPVDPWWLQPFVRDLPVGLVWLTTGLTAAAFVLLIVAGVRMRSAQPANAWLAATCCALSAMAISVAVATTADPRGHERSAAPADSLAVLTFLDENTGDDAISVLDVQAGFDASGRHAFWLNRAPLTPPYVVWPRIDPAARGASDLSLSWLRRWTQEQNQVWLVLLETDEGDPASTTERWFDGDAYRGRQVWIGSQRLVEYWLTPATIEPGTTVAATQQFGPDLALTSYTVTATPAALLVDMAWTDVSPDNLRFSLQVLDAEGRLVAQIDRRPAALSDRTDRVGLALPSTGNRLILKVYDSVDGQPLPVFDAAGLSTEFLILWTVGEPS